MEHPDIRRLRESGIPLDTSWPMHAMFAGIRTEDGEPPPLINPQEWDQEEEAFAAEESEWWKGRSVPIHLMVELPFWLMIPDCELSVPHDDATVTASVRGHYMEVSDGPLALDSHVNVVHIGPNDELKAGKDQPSSVAQTEAPVYRPMKTVVVFQPMAMEDSLVALQERKPPTWQDRTRLRRINRASKYLQSLAYAHIPFLNRLITSYRSTSLDPFAFQVSEWDVPVWFALFKDMIVPMGLMPYWGNDWYPTLRKMGGGETTAFVASPVDAVQTQVKSEVMPGRLELLDALSLSYRGRFDDAVRSAVTAIEVALECQLRQLLEAKGYTDDQSQRRLDETRNTFEKRLADYEKLSKKRLPGPVLSCVPYINGIRFKSELWQVRELRHKIVHEGVRVDIHSRGPMLRAIETMTWLFRWLTWEDGDAQEDSKNYVFFSLMRGNFIYPVEYSSSGVVVVPLDRGDDKVKTGSEMFAAQYAGAIDSPDSDNELFVKMSFGYLGMEAVDAPPALPGDALLHERYHIIYDQRLAIVFCLEFDGLIDSETIGSVALGSLAASRRDGPGCSTLCVVHHQRYFPMELRETENAISGDVTRIAEECGLTLVTAPDLFLLVRGMMEYRWDADQVCNLLFLPGWQGRVPPVYHRIGTYGRFYDRQSAMSVNLDPGETVKLGDTLGIRTCTRYHEEEIESLQVEHDVVSTATGPCKVGIKTTLGKRDLNTGQAAFIRLSAENDTGRVVEG